MGVNKVQLLFPLTASICSRSCLNQRHVPWNKLLLYGSVVVEAAMHWHMGRCPQQHMLIYPDDCYSQDRPHQVRDGILPAWLLNEAGGKSSLPLVAEGDSG